MRTLVKNKQALYYANYVSKAEITDEYGNKTGQYQITYGTPILTAWNIRAVNSDVDVEMFGVLAKDTIRIVIEKPLPIDETSILWFGETPSDPYVATSPGNNYKISGIPPTLNDAIVYATKVDVG